MKYLESALKQFEYYKLLGEKTIGQLPEEKLFWQYSEESNSIAMLVQHLSGNMLSRWTDFLEADGEKEWRNRDAEFERFLTTKKEVLEAWNAGWKVLLDTLKSLQEEDLERIVYIRNQGQTVLEAINRQLAHYPYHIGQLVFVGKMCAEHWESLSIPKGKSSDYNANKFSKPKSLTHFTEEFLEEKKLPRKNCVLILHEVDDYAAWKIVFDNAAQIRKEAGEISYQVLQFDSDSNRIVHFSVWNSLDNARAFFESPRLVQIRKEAGVKSPEFIYLEELVAGLL